MICVSYACRIWFNGLGISDKRGDLHDGKISRRLDTKRIDVGEISRQIIIGSLSPRTGIYEECPKCFRLDNEIRRFSPSEVSIFLNGFALKISRLLA